MHFAQVVLLIPILSSGIFAATHAAINYLNLPDGTQSLKFVADGAGNSFVASYAAEPYGFIGFRVDKVNAQGVPLAGIDLGTKIQSVGGMAIDPAGNLVMVGTTSSPDFPLVSPLISNTSNQSAFIMKLDPGLTSILYSTRLGGTKSAGPIGGTSGAALALDPQGNFIVTGATWDTDFPITPGAYQSQPPRGDAFGTSTFAFVTKISADGQKLIFSTYFGSDHVICIGGSHCIGAHGQTAGAAIALDSDGNVVIGGDTTSDQLPMTPGVLGPTCVACAFDLGTTFVAKFSSDASTLLWATYFPIQNEIPGPWYASLNALAIDPAGNVIVAGRTPPGFPATEDAVQPDPIANANSATGFVAKIDPSATTLLFATYLGGAAELNGLTMDASGTIWVTGIDAMQHIPSPPQTPLLGPDYIAGLSPDGTQVTTLYTAPDGACGQAILQTNNGTLVTLGRKRAWLEVLAGDGPSLVSVSNYANLATSPTVAPNELISILGINVGPPVPAGLEIKGGVATNSLRGYEVLFDGVPSPLLYVGPYQINAIIPSAVSGQETTSLSIVSPSGTLAGPTMLVRPTQPAVIPRNLIDSILVDPDGLPAQALNQDGTENTETNPASSGSIVSIWATGAGASVGTDGEVVQTPISTYGAAVLLQYGPVTGSSLEVLYSGDAPGLVRGIAQINFRLPQQYVPILDPYPRLAFTLQFGNASSVPFSIYVKR